MKLGCDSIDWSSKGIFATIIENEIYTTNECYQQNCQSNTMKAIDSTVKWNKTGDKFACALKGGKISVWDLNTFKVKSIFLILTFN